MMTEPLVLIPPMLCDARVFSYQIADLSADCPMMAVPTACGERIEEVASSILSWAPSKFALLGASMGGAVALEMMRRAPERITRIALVAAIAGAETPEGASAREPLIVAARSGRFEEVIGREFAPDALAHGPGRETILGHIRDMALGLGPEAYVRQARAMQRRRDQQITLRKIKQPALVLAGQEDGLSPLKRQEFLAEMIPYAQFEVIPGAGHFPMLEQPDSVTEAIRGFMRQPLVLR